MKKISKFIALTLGLISVLSCVACSNKNDVVLNDYVTQESTATAYYLDGSEFTPVIRFVVASDTHVFDSYYAGSEKRIENLFLDMYNYADTQEYKGLDAVVLCGDVCEQGTETQYQALEKAWTKNIKSETAFLCLQAGHELISGTTELHKLYTGTETMGMHVSIKGYHFITISNGRVDENGVWNLPDEECDLPWIQEQLAIADSDGDKPIFTFGHHPIVDTIEYSQGGDPGWQPEPIYSSTFAEYQNIVYFSGHMHTPIKHPRAIWQAEFTNIAAGSMNYTTGVSDYIPANVDMSLPPENTACAGAQIIEIDAQNRIRILPYSVADREFYTEMGSDKQDRQLVRYVEDVFDKSTWLYTEERYDSADTPVFSQEASIYDITFSTQDVWAFKNGSTTTVKEVRPTISFTFDVAIDNDGIEGYEIEIVEKVSNAPIYFYQKNLWDKYVTLESAKKYQTSYYFMYRNRNQIDFTSTGISLEADKGLVLGKTYQITVKAYDAYHKFSSNVLTTEFIYE